MDLLHAHWHYFVLELKFTKCQIFITASAFSFSAREENIRNQKPSRTHLGAWKAQEETKQRHNWGKEWGGTYLQNGKHTCRGEAALHGFGSCSNQAHQQLLAAAESTEICQHNSSIQSQIKSLKHVRNFYHTVINSLAQSFFAASENCISRAAAAGKAQALQFECSFQAWPAPAWALLTAEGPRWKLPQPGATAPCHCCFCPCCWQQGRRWHRHPATECSENLICSKSADITLGQQLVIQIPN